MMVYTTGFGVHGFTLDPSIGEFILSHPDIRIPTPPARSYSVNEAYASRWSPGVQAFVGQLKEAGSRGEEGYSARYIGSLVADFHRTLLKGGIFLYPADRRSPSGKLRLIYEAAPLALIAEAAGGKASNGRDRILDLEPTTLHERTPLFIGSSELVTLAEDFLANESAV
jgi:fructose-1,6-bisphosphatase I